MSSSSKLRPGATPAKPAGTAATRTSSSKRLLHDLQVHQVELETQNQELLRAQTLLEELRDRYLDLYDFAPVGYLSLSLKGLITESNLKCAKLLGVDRNVLLGQPISRFIFADDREGFSRLRSILGKNAPPVDYDLRMLRQDGSQIWVRMTATLAEPGGHGHMIRIALSDITESRQADSLIRASEQRLKLVIEAIGDGFWDWDLRTGVVYRSPSYYATIGFRADDATPDFGFFKRIAHPDDLPSALKALEAHLRGETPGIEFEFRLASPSGGREWMGVRGRVVERNAAGAAVRVAGTISDITERKYSEARLRASEERFRAVFDNSIDAILITMPEVGIVAANPAAQQMFQLTEAEFRKVGRSDLVDMSDGRVLAALDERTRTGHFSGELKFLRKDGSDFIGELTSSVFAGSDGKLLTNVIVRDISRRKQAEAELAATRTEMQQIIEWQVARNTAAALAHELNQPLTAVSALSEATTRILAGTVGSQEQDPGQLGNIAQRLALESERAGNVVRNLLDSLHRPVSKTETCDLGAIVKQAAGVIGASMSNRYRLILEFAPNLPPVQVNYQQIEKVLLNLAGNGADSMHNAGMAAGEISIRAELSEHGKSARITVRDQGPGIPPGMEQEIFHPFVTTRVDGMGMGLAIARALVEAQGGKLWLDPTPDAGARFCFTLPLARGESSPST